MPKSKQELVIHRKKLLWRANHRGMKEMDLMLGGFATKFLDEMGEAELEEFAGILAVSDAQLSDWITGKTDTPVEFQTPLFLRISQQSFVTLDYKKL